MGLTRIRADQISNIDYKQAVKVITLTNISNLSNGAPLIVDGVTLAVGDRVLVSAQSTGSQNGIYVVNSTGTGSNGSWVRATDANATGDLEAGTIVMVTDGSTYADTSWKLITDDPIDIGVTALTFLQNTGNSFNIISTAASNVAANGVSGTVTFTAGNNFSVVGNNASDVITFSVVDAPTFVGNVNITSTTASTSKTTGALTVAGGVGVASDVWAGNSITVDGGAYGNVVTTQFAGVFATASGPNPYSIVQVRSNDGTTGLGMQAYTGLNGLIYSNSGVTFQTGATIRDKDYPTGGTTRATIDSTGLSVTGNVSATGNITGSYILGNGSQLTGLPATYGNSDVAAYLASGTLSANILTTGAVSATGNVIGTNFTTAGTVSATGNITAGNFDTLGIVFAGDVNSTGTVSATGQVTGGNISTTGTVASGVVSASGNVSSANMLTSGLISATGNITGANIAAGGTVSATGNVIADSFFTGGIISATGNITGSSLNIGSILNTNANASGNIGNSTNYFDTVFAKATSAQYADLAEMYCADAEYPPGTLLEFGGEKEVTITTETHTPKSAGIVSTHPSYLMNSTLDCACAVELALVGRVPSQVVGTIRKGDRLVASNIPGVATALNMALYQPGCIVGKALEDYNSTEVGIIEVAVGRF